VTEGRSLRSEHVAAGGWTSGPVSVSKGNMQYDVSQSVQESDGRVQ